MWRSVAQQGAVVLALVATTIAGCGQGTTPAPVPVPDWVMTLDVDGATVTLPLEVMDVYLVDDNAIPEAFEISGDGITLIGAFPLDVHVDYGENWTVLKGRNIPISATTDNPNTSDQSFITLPDEGVVNVTAGSFEVKSIDGTYGGSDGDMTVSGTVTLDIETDSGSRSVSGTFAVHAVTWG